LRAVFRTNGAAKASNDAIADRKSKPQPIAKRLGGKEGIKKLWQIVWQYAVAVVVDLDDQAVLAACDRDTDFRLFDVLARISSIVDQIDKDLGKLACLGDDWFNVTILLKRDIADTRTPCLKNQINGLLHLDGNINRLVVLFWTSRKCFEVIGDPAHAISKFGDALEVAVRRFVVATGNELQRIFRIVANGSQGLVDFMGNSRRHLPKGGQLACLNKFGLGGAKGILVARPLRDFFCQALVGVHQVGGPQPDLAFKFAL